jgi:NADH-quinone oxidoreductase subunit N
MFFEKVLQIFQEYKSISAELCISFLIFLNFILFFFTSENLLKRAASFTSICLIFAAIYFSIDNISDDSVLLFNQMYLINKNNSIIKILIMIGVSLVHLKILFMPKSGVGIEDRSRFELPTLINFSLLGLMCSVSANDFLILYLGLELSAISGYILTALKKDSTFSLEAGVKYFVLGVLASSVFLYGISLVYSAFGSTNYEIIGDLLINRDTEFSFVGLVGIIFIFFGLIFKLGAAPLHVWICDVYQGSHGIVLAFFSGAPKVAVAYVIYILYHFVFVGRYFQYTTSLIGLFAVVSLFVGSIGAIAQTNFKRLIGYSAVLSAGFILLNILGDLSYSFNALVTYSVAYMLGSYGLITLLMYYWSENHDEKNYLISDFAGLSKSHPFLAMAISGILFSIAGIPPFLGFFGKLYIFLASVSSLQILITFCAVIASVISLVYYLGIIKVMYFQDRVLINGNLLSLKRYKAMSIGYALILLIGIFYTNYLINLIS